MGLVKLWAIDPFAAGTSAFPPGSYLLLVLWHWELLLQKQEADPTLTLLSWEDSQAKGLNHFPCSTVAQV